MQTEIETKALEAACEKATDKLEIDWDGDEPFVRSDSIETAVEAAIRAYLAALDSPIGEQGVGVKALTWEPVPDGVYVGEACRAESVVGTYLAQEGTSYFNDELIGEDGETMPDGKAIAQVDFTRRILSALSPERKEPVAWRLLQRGEMIEPTDQFLQDDAVTWRPCANEWCVGAEYSALFQPMRRRAAVPATPGQPT